MKPRPSSPWTIVRPAESWSLRLQKAVLRRQLRRREAPGLPVPRLSEIPPSAWPRALHPPQSLAILAERQLAPAGPWALRLQLAASPAQSGPQGSWLAPAEPSGPQSCSAPADPSGPAHRTCCTLGGSALSPLHLQRRRLPSSTERWTARLVGEALSVAAAKRLKLLSSPQWHAPPSQYNIRVYCLHDTHSTQGTCPHLALGGGQ